MFLYSKLNAIVFLHWGRLFAETCLQNIQVVILLARSLARSLSLSLYIYIYSSIMN